ncbi:MAG TPA: 30S ribosome-binding factor RbfA [Gemmatimonadaceae bacterium]|jgi:ribosome-binding factor A|nr:30S ribosome-binding factor RbfA [Gemmatimonadaceae bacterium]
MPNDHRRADRVAEAIREEIATFLAEEAKDPRITRLVTVTGVEVTRDLRHAKVFVSVMGTDAERAQTFEGLASVALHLRSRVGRALRLRLAPEITFLPDQSIERAARIESLLAQIKSAQPPAPPSHGDTDD